MSDRVPPQGLDPLRPTVELLSAYVSNANTRLSPDELDGLLRRIYTTLADLQGKPNDQVSSEKDTHARSSEIKRSIGPDALISFEDGKPYKSLKRHLSARGLTPEQYRAKWGLPADYPMTHPTYSAKRAALARQIGLGGKVPKPASASSEKTRGPKRASFGAPHRR